MTEIGDTEHETPECRCVNCDESLAVSNGVNCDQPPQADDFTICVYCGKIHKFLEDMSLEGVSINDVPPENREDIRHVQRGIRETHDQRRT